MRLVENWWVVLTRAWSVRLMLAAALLSGVEVAIAALGNVFGWPTGLFAALSGLVTAGALIARVVLQVKIGGEP